MCIRDSNNIACKVEEALREKRNVLHGSPEIYYVPTVFSMNCFGHSCVLCSRPILKSFDGLSSFVVRRGHLCQSWRSASKCTEAMETELKTHF
eukprot:3358073-Pyramimonas_sp.AAC.1